MSRGFSIVKSVNVLTEPVDLDQLKLYVQVRSEFHDGLLNKLLKAARIQVENFLCLSLIETTITARWEEMGTEELPYGPVMSLTSVQDGSGSDASYTMEGLIGDFITIKANRTSPTVIKYIAGYEADQVPEPIQLAIMKLVVDNFEQRTGIALQYSNELPNNWKQSCGAYSRLVWSS